MRKLFVVLCILLGGLLSPLNSQTMFDGSSVPLIVVFDDPTGSMGEIPRGPIVPPCVTLDDHTLYYNSVDYSLTMVLLDEDGNVAYSTIVPANTPSIILPATLTGNYTLQLYPGGSYYFEGEIIL